MKKFFILAIAFLGLSSSIVSAIPQDLSGHQVKIDSADLSIDRVININELTAEKQSDLLMGKFQNIVVECSAGNTIPFRFAINGDYFGTDPYEGNTILLHVHQTFYLTCCADELMISDNLNDWYYFDDFFNSEDSLLIADHGGGTEFTLEANVLRNWGHEECDCIPDENGNCTCGEECADCHDEEPLAEETPV